MTVAPNEDDGTEARKLEAMPESMRVTETGIEIAIRLRNPLARAVHYIADVRAMLFDPATRRLRVQLSDRGRESPLGGVMVLPRFRMVDPHGEALVTIQLPRTIVRLAGDSPPDGLQFEEHVITEALAIDVEMGWSDTPFYNDPREGARGESPVSAWEDDEIRVTFTVDA